MDGMIQPVAALGRAAGGGGDGGRALRFRSSPESGLRPARPELALQRVRRIGAVRGPPPGNSVGSR